MSGWRDVEGRTAPQRRQLEREAARAEFVDTARRRPFALLKGVAGFVFVMILVIAVLLALR